MRYLLSLLLVIASSAFAEEPPTPVDQAASTPPRKTSAERAQLAKGFRRHFVARDGKGNLVYEATEVVTLSDVSDESILLVWDHGATRGLRFRTGTDFKTKLATSSVEELEGGSFFRIEFLLPFVGKTREAVLQESRDNPRVVETSEASITLITNTLRRTGLESAWSDESTSRGWRTELRASLSPAFLESLERVRGGLLQHLLLSSYRGSLLNFLYWGDGAADVTALNVVGTEPDCRFDADMGQPCTKDQLRRIEDAVKAGKRLVAY